MIAIPVYIAHTGSNTLFPKKYPRGKKAVVIIIGQICLLCNATCTRFFSVCPRSIPMYDTFFIYDAKTNTALAVLGVIASLPSRNAFVPINIHALEKQGVRSGGRARSVRSWALRPTYSGWNAVALDGHKSLSHKPCGPRRQKYSCTRYGFIFFFWSRLSF